MNTDEFIENFKKDLADTKVFCEGCKKNIKFKILKDVDGEYIYECPKHLEVDLTIENDVLGA